ncbi:hypothetical protein HRbin06_00587 [archaeon HR06]|nr:hypothetical protein HRbin06_00587 [archaeon HR06]
MIVCYNLTSSISEYPDKSLLTKFTIYLRGALGYCIKDVNKELYYYCFKPKRSKFRGYLLKKLRYIPKPIIITPPIIFNDKINFKVRVFGSLIYYEKDIIDALSKLSERDLHGVKLRILSIEYLNEMFNISSKIFNGKYERKDSKKFVITDKDIKDFSKKIINMSKDYIEFSIESKTPIMIVKDGINVIEKRCLNLSNLIAYGCRRRSLLSYFYGKGLYYTAEEVNSMIDYANKNSEVLRFESKESDIKLKGRKGFYYVNVSFKVKIDDSIAVKIIELLKFCEFMGIGKMVSFGMGQYELKF